MNQNYNMGYANGKNKYLLRVKLLVLMMKNYQSGDMSNRNNTLLDGKLDKLGSIGNFQNLHHMIFVKLHGPAGQV